MEVFLNRVAKLGGAVAAGAIVGNNFLFNGKDYSSAPSSIGIVMLSVIPHLTMFHYHDGD